jgi:hypothetical protein
MFRYPLEEREPDGVKCSFLKNSDFYLKANLIDLLDHGYEYSCYWYKNN